MKVQIMTDTKFGNGKLLAETLKEEFSPEMNVNIADVKEVSPEKIAEDVPRLAVFLRAAEQCADGAAKGRHGHRASVRRSVPRHGTGAARVR